MNYYDGNTVTGRWNYANNFSMSDNSFSTHAQPYYDQFKGKFAVAPASDQGLCNAVHPVTVGTTTPSAASTTPPTRPPGR